MIFGPACHCSFRADQGAEAFSRIHGYYASLRDQGVGLLAALQSAFFYTVTLLCSQDPSSRRTA